MKNQLITQSLVSRETNLHSNLIQQEFLLSGAEKEVGQQSFSLEVKVIEQVSFWQHALSSSKTADSWRIRTRQTNSQQTMNGTVRAKTEPWQGQLMAMKLTQEEAQFLLMMCVMTSVEGSEQLEHSVIEKVLEVVRRFDT